MNTPDLSWGWVASSAVLGLVLFLAGVVWFGRRIFKRMGFRDRGEWDRPLAHPLPKDQVVATYVRRKWFHRHHRAHYLRRNR